MFYCKCYCFWFFNNIKEILPQINISVTTANECCFLKNFQVQTKKGENLFKDFTFRASLWCVSSCVSSSLWATFPDFRSCTVDQWVSSLCSNNRKNRFSPNGVVSVLIPFIFKQFPKNEFFSFLFISLTQKDPTPTDAVKQCMFVYGVSLHVLFVQASSCLFLSSTPHTALLWHTCSECFSAVVRINIDGAAA